MGKIFKCAWKAIGRSQMSKFESKPSSTFMHGSRNFCQRRSTLNIFLMMRGEGRSKYIYKRAIIGTPVKRHLNGLSLACRWWPNIECWLGSFGIFRGSGPILQRNPIFLWFFRGGEGRPPALPSGSVHVIHTRREHSVEHSQKEHACLSIE